MFLFFFVSSCLICSALELCRFLFLSQYNYYRSLDVCIQHNNQFGEKGRELSVYVIEGPALIMKYRRITNFCVLLKMISDFSAFSHCGSYRSTLTAWVAETGVLHSAATLWQYCTPRLAWLFVACWQLNVSKISFYVVRISPKEGTFYCSSWSVFRFTINVFLSTPLNKSFYVSGGNLICDLRC